MDIASVIRFGAVLTWIIVVALVVVIVSRAGRGQNTKGLNTAATVVVAVALLFSVLGAGLVFVEPDALGVVITAFGSGGIRSEPLQSGLHWITPFVERVETYSILNQNYTMSSTTGEGQVASDDSIQVRTKDGQQVFIDASVIYAIDPLKAVDLYKTWRTTYENGLVRPQARGVIRDVASQYGVEEIVSTKRIEMEQSITDQLIKIFAANNLVLRDFVLRNIRFSDEYAAAVEQKQIAEQQALQAKFVVESKKQEAEQARQVAQGAADAVVIASKGAADARVIQAEAEAKALQLIAEVLKSNPDLLTYQYITKLSPNVEVMMVPSGSPFILTLPQLQGGVSAPK